MRQHRAPNAGRITKPLLKQVVNRQKADFRRLVSIATIGSAPLLPPDCYQDAGGGYNHNLTFLQE